MALEQKIPSVLSALAALVIAGCATPPSDLPLDKGVVESGWTRPPQKDKRVLVISKVTPNSEDGSDKSVFNDEMAGKAITERLGEMLTKVPGFINVDLENNELAQRFKWVNGNMEGMGELPDIDYVLMAQSAVGYVSSSGNAIKVARKAEGVTIETTFTLLDIKTQKPLLTETFTNESRGKSTPDVPKCIKRAVAENVKGIKHSLARKYVVSDLEIKEVRGGGQFALIPVGKRHGIEPGDTFAFYAKQKAGNGWVDKEFAAGRVTEFVEPAQCWVAIDDFSSAGVKRGHFAKLSN